MKRCFDQISPNNELHTDGYTLIKKAIKISPKVSEEIINYTNKHARPIFNHHESRIKNDKKRKQTNLPIKNKNINNFTKMLNEYLLKNVNPNLSVSRWVSIHSLPKCGDQAAHCDYERDKSLMNVSNDFMPLGVLVALQPTTKLHVWPKSIHNPKVKLPIQIERTTINMDAEDIIIFRGDLVHAGSSYDENNYRLHAYMDSPRVPRIRNRTWLISRHADEKMKNIIKT